MERLADHNRRNGMCTVPLFLFYLLTILAIYWAKRFANIQKSKLIIFLKTMHNMSDRKRTTPTEVSLKKHFIYVN